VKRHYRPLGIGVPGQFPRSGGITRRRSVLGWTFIRQRSLLGLTSAFSERKIRRKLPCKISRRSQTLNIRGSFSTEVQP
jgi:hypothetical protein